MPGIVLGDAPDAKTTLLAILNTHASTMEMPGIVLGDAPVLCFREICTFGVISSSLGQKPLTTKWCYDPTQGDLPGSQAQIQLPPLPPNLAILHPTPPYSSNRFQFNCIFSYNVQTVLKNSSHFSLRPKINDIKNSKHMSSS